MARSHYEQKESFEEAILRIALKSRKRLHSATLPKKIHSLPAEKLYGSSVDAYWHPLTPEHGFPSLKIKTQGAPPQSATYVDLRFLLSKVVCKVCFNRLLNTKTGDTF